MKMEMHFTYYNLQRINFCYDHSDNQWFRWTGIIGKKTGIEEVLASIESIVQLYVRGGRASR